LNARDAVLAAVPERAPLVEHAVDSFPDTGLIADRNGWPLHQQALNVRAEIAAVLPVV
jgi:hypothetical protein